MTGAGGVVALVVDGVRFLGDLRSDGTVRFGHEPRSDVHLPPVVDVPSASVAVAGDELTVTCVDETVTGPADGGWLAVDLAGARGQVRYARRSARTGYDLRGREEIVVSPAPGADVRVLDPAFSFTARRHAAGGWAVSVDGDDVFVAHRRRPRGRLHVVDGEHLGTGTHTVVLLADELHVDDDLVADVRLPRRHAGVGVLPDGYPEVRRSPRLVHRPPEGTLTLDGLPDEGDRRTGQLAKLLVPPLLMLAVTVGTAFAQGNPLLVLATGSTTAATVGFSLHGYLKDRRKQASENAARRDAYERHLLTRAVEVHRAAEQQRAGALYHHPDVSTLLTLAAEVSPRVFEKAPTHEDFLGFRLGLGKVAASTTLEYADRDRVTRDDDLEDAARHLDRSAATLDGMPVVADLRHGPVGYVGPRRLVVEQLQLLVMQLAFFHSYHEVQVVVVLPEAELSDWWWLRWFRHAGLRDVNLRSLVHDQRSRDQVLSTLAQVLKARRTALDERRAGSSTVFSPHYVVLLLDETLVLDHAVMELLRADPTELGCSVVVMKETMSALADSVTTVVDIRDRDTGVLVLERGDLADTRFVPDHLAEGFHPERLSRTVGALRHVLDARSSIPESVSFLELYGVDRVEQLQVADRWAANSPHRSLGVPLGLRGPGDVVRLDLHEKAHGPHGLVAGTTGSGKSEIVQSYILSLAVNFHPHDVAFLLIDYKGGGMANLFAELPHLLGAITNLDGAQSMRALVSINAELKRRQRVFSEHGVNHINQYQKLVKNGDAAEPMPHLFLISDEFAELKSEQPEFMDELISTARIGRSLGIHLILATQKPSGVVNDQIWSNSKFKLALKVADRSDSMEIIKTPDAAEITLPGRAYLQVGNNEIYELFQSAWSGADYDPDAVDDRQEDRAIYAINDLGQYEILTQDLSGLDAADAVTQVPTELEAVVAAIRDVARAAAIEPVPRPWLPPLPERIVVTDLQPADPETRWAGPKEPLRPVIGTVDVPSQQRQRTLSLNLTGDGHLAVFGSPGYGKSTFLQTLVMGLARIHRPDHLHVYLVDLGTNGLLPLSGLPHVADTVTSDDEQRAAKLAERLEGELVLRKRRLSQHAAANLEMYERASGEVMPALLLVVDGLDGLRETSFDERLMALLTSVAREGAGLGIHLALTAGRRSTVRGSLAANIKSQVVLRLNDDAEVRDIVGRTTLQIDDVPGRGLVRLDQPEIFQTALPAPGGDPLEVVESIRGEAARLDAAWSGDRPAPLPVIPDRLALPELLAHDASAELVAQGATPVGLDFGTVQPVGLHLARHRVTVVLCKDAETVTSAVSTLWSAGSRQFPGGAYVLEDQVGTLSALSRATRPGATGVADVLDAALSELDARCEQFRSTPGRPLSLSEYVRTLRPALVVVADPSTSDELLGPERVADLVRLLTDGPKYGMPVLLGLTFAGCRLSGDVGRVVKAATTGLLLGRFADQSLLTRPAGVPPTREPQLGESEAYLVVDGAATRVKLPAPS